MSKEFKSCPSIDVTKRLNRKAGVENRKDPESKNPRDSSKRQGEHHIFKANKITRPQAKIRMKTSGISLRD